VLSARSIHAWSTRTNRIGKRCCGSQVAPAAGERSVDDGWGKPNNRLCYSQGMGNGWGSCVNIQRWGELAYEEGTRDVPRASVQGCDQVAIGALADELAWGSTTLR
jgi:hypothetical protein